MHFIYFIEPYSNDYIIFGRSQVKTFYHRFTTYKCSYPKIKVIGIHPTESERSARDIETQLMKMFEVTNPERSRCEMLWNTKALQEYILEHTIEVNPVLEETKKYKRIYEKKRREQDSNWIRQRHTARERERRQTDPEYRKYLSDNVQAYKKRKRLETHKNQLTLFD